MPSGRVHDTIAWSTTAAAAPLIWYNAPAHARWLAFAALGSYLLGSLYLSADLDTASDPFKRWGRLRFLWWPYRTIVPHRSRLSHGIVLGPTIRVIYFAVMLSMTAWGLIWLLRSWGAHIHPNLGEWGAVAWRVIAANPNTLSALAVGLILASAIHVVADIAVSAVKRVL